MKFPAERPYANPEAAARKLIEIANTVEAVQDGRIYIEKINWPLAIARGWLWLHDSGNYVKFTQGRRGAVRVKEAAS